ncbi:unnamed protein product [Coccothraustes coccothraustes]
MSGCAFPGCSSPASALGLAGSVSGGREAAAEGPPGPPPAAPAGGAGAAAGGGGRGGGRRSIEDRQAEMSRRNVPQR